jgi:predicted TPR repeat methyltransferase
MKDTAFYNQESTQYSSKRYAKVAHSYLQLFYAHRLEITKKYLRAVLEKLPANPSLLEVGCADGVIVRELCKDFPEIGSIVGIDISPGMIDAAQSQNTDARATYQMRSEYTGAPVDILVETGVVNYSDVDAEVLFAHQNIKEEGWYILSVAGTGSLYNRIKHDGGLADHRPYKEYDRIIRQHFIVHKVLGTGFFIPLVWKVPPLARALQGLAEVTLGAIFPGLCHEKMYLLQKK